MGTLAQHKVSMSSLNGTLRILNKTGRNQAIRFWSTGLQALKVIHKPAENRFIIDLKHEGRQKTDIAELEYIMKGSKTMDMIHTRVPESMRGRGIAAILAKEAFDYCVTKDYKMILSCSYLPVYL